MGVTAMQAAKRACEASGWKLTNLQLQKILYIAQMVYAGKNHGDRLISGDDFEAWDYGPVLPALYHRVSSFGSSAIKNIFHGVEDITDKEADEFIAKAAKNLSSIPPFRLVEYVHDKHSAWHRHYRPGVRGIAIPHESVIEENKSRAKARKASATRRRDE